MDEHVISEAHDILHGNICEDETMYTMSKIECNEMLNGICTKA